jgi:hypothetical protein
VASCFSGKRPLKTPAAMGRFDDRTTRLARRQESDAFRNYVMPINWLIGLEGISGRRGPRFSGSLSF